MKRRFPIWILGLCLCAWLQAADEPSALEKAQREIALQNFKGALPMMEEIRAVAQDGSDDWLAATIGMAVCYHQRQPDTESDKKEAAQLYETVINKTNGKKHKLEPLALFMRARLADLIDYHSDTPDPKTAKDCYEKLMEAWPEHELAGYAALFRAVQEVESGDAKRVRAGVDLLKSWLEKHPKNPLAATQWSLIAQAYMLNLDEPANAVSAYRKVLDAGLVDMRPDKTFWRIAIMAQKAGDKKTAIEFYTRIINEVPRSPFGYESQLRLKDLGVENPPELQNPFEDGGR